MGRDKRGKGDGGDGGGSAAGPGVIKRWKWRAREAFEHRPKELHISVNGLLQGSQKINSELSEQTLDVDMAEQIGFVEVYSELGIRLLMLNVGDEPPRGPVEQSTRVELSDNRELELKLRYSSPWPTLHVAYSDPLMSSSSELAGPAALSYSQATSTFVSLDLTDPSTLSAATDSAGIDTKAVTAHRTSKSGSIRNLLNFFRGTRFWLSPATATALVALVSIGIFLLTRSHGPVAPLSAAELLRESIQREDELVTRTDQVLHRTLTLEERLLSEPRAIATGSSPAPADTSSKGSSQARSPARAYATHRRIEVWQSAANGTTARRLYDDKGALIAGDWCRADGVQTLYHHGSKPQLQPVPEGNGLSTPSFDSVWQLSPSADEFNRLIPAGALPRVEVEPSRYVISYEAGSDRVDPTTAPIYTGQTAQLLRASIVLNRQDLRGIEAAFVISQGSETREYRFTEIGFEQLAPSAVPTAIFIPESELLSTAAKTTETEAVAVSPNVPVIPSLIAASSALEVEVLERLNRANAFLGDQLTVTRDSDGRLRIDAIIDTAERKQEILRALGPVVNNPALRVSVDTVAERQSRQARQAAGQRQSSSVSLEAVQVTTQTIAVDSELRDFFRLRGLSGEQLELEMRRFADRMLQHSFQARLHARALKQIAERFNATELSNLDNDARTRLRTMLNEHGRACRQETQALRVELKPLFPTLADTSGVESKVASDEELLQSVSRLYQLIVANDESLRRSFSLYADRPVDAPVRSLQFWRSLATAESLAQVIASGPGPSQNRER